MKLSLVILGAAVVLTGCAAPQDPERVQTGAEDQRPAGPKRLLAGIMGDPPTFSQKINTPGAGNIPGAAEVGSLLNASLSVKGDRGEQMPVLAEAVPSVDNGLWRLFPDGQMETTWKLRRQAVWHDGTAFTAADLLFTARLEGDRELPISHGKAFELVTAVEAPDPRILTLRWKEPYIYADTLFGSFIVPKHLMESVYLEDKANFPQAPYWTSGFVGTGPFKLREWVRGSYMVVEAFDRYVLGRARIDEIEIKFIPDPSTLVANILAGSVELTLGRSLSLDQAMRLQEQWGEGRMHPGPGTTWIVVYPQFLNPTPPVVALLPFRRALYHAIDRQQVAEAVQAGLFPVAHTYTSPSEPDFPHVQSAAVRYEYDVRRATQLLDGLGFAKGPNGALRDAAGQRLSLELRTTREDIHEKSLFSVADYWQRLGVAVDQVVIPQQRVRDQEYRATFPAFQVLIQSNSLSSLGRFRSTTTPLAETNWVGNNYPRYRDAELDALVDRYFVTVPPQERLAVLGLMERHFGDNLVLMPLFYSSNPFMIGKRVEGVGESRLAANQWNVHLWDLE